MSYIYSLGIFFSFCWLVVIALCYLHSLSLSVCVCVSLCDVHSHGIAKEYTVIFKCLGEKNNSEQKTDSPIGWKCSHHIISSIISLNIPSPNLAAQFGCMRSF